MAQAARASCALQCTPAGMHPARTVGWPGGPRCPGRVCPRWCLPVHAGLTPLRAQTVRWAQNRAVAIDAATGDLAACVELLQAVQQLHPSKQLAAAEHQTRELQTLSGAHSALHAAMRAARPGSAGLHCWAELSCMPVSRRGSMLALWLCPTYMLIFPQGRGPHPGECRSGSTWSAPGLRCCPAGGPVHSRPVCSSLL